MIIDNRYKTAKIQKVAHTQFVNELLGFIQAEYPSAIIRGDYYNGFEILVRKFKRGFLGSISNRILPQYKIAINVRNFNWHDGYKVYVTCHIDGLDIESVCKKYDGQLIGEIVIEVG